MIKMFLIKFLESFRLTFQHPKDYVNANVKFHLANYQHKVCIVNTDIVIIVTVTINIQTALAPWNCDVILSRQFAHSQWSGPIVP